MTSPATQAIQAFIVEHHHAKPSHPGWIGERVHAAQANVLREALGRVQEAEAAEKELGDKRLRAAMSSGKPDPWPWGSM